MKKISQLFIVLVLLFPYVQPLSQVVYAEDVAENTEVLSTIEETTISTKDEEQALGSTIESTVESEILQQEEEVEKVKGSNDLAEGEQTTDTSTPQPNSSQIHNDDFVTDSAMNRAFGIMSLPKEATPKIEIDYTEEKLTGFDATASYELRAIGNTPKKVEGVTAYPISADMLGTVGSWKAWTVVRLASSDEKQNSDGQVLQLPVKDIIASTYVTVKHESSAGAKDGALNLRYDTVQVEYRKKGENDWISIPKGGSAEGLSPGVYEARYAVREKQFASLSREYTINAGKEKEATPKIEIDYTEEKLIGFDATASYELRDGGNKVKTVSGVTEYPIPADMHSTVGNGKEWKIVRLASSTEKQNSDAQVLMIPALDRISSNYITVKHESWAGAKDGALNLRYDTIQVEYRKKGENTWISIPKGGSAEGLSPGDYEARYAATETNFASLSREYTINAGKEKEATPKIEIDYKEEKLIGFDATASYELRDGGNKVKTVSGVTEYPIPADMHSMVGNWKEWKVVRLASSTEKQNSDAQVLKIPALDKISSNYITVKHESWAGANDGALNLRYDTLQVEYRKKGENTWTEIPKGGSAEGLSPGIYEARYAATETNFASLSREYTINAGKEKEATPKIEIDYKEEKLTGFDATASYELRDGGNKVKTVSGVTEYPIPEDMHSMVGNGKEWKIVRLASSTEKQNSDAQVLMIPALDKISSNYITVKHESWAGAKDGSLNLRYDTLEVEYRKKGDGDWISIPKGGAAEGLAPGVYEARYAATETNFASLSREYTINAGKEKEATPKIEIDYKEEKLTGFDASAKYKLVSAGNTRQLLDMFNTDLSQAPIIISGVTEYAISEAMMNDKVWTIVRLASDPLKQDSDEQKFVIPARAPLAENLVTIKHETKENAKDGQLVFSDNSKQIEFRKLNSDNWLLVDGMVASGLEPAVYEVRYKTSDSNFAGQTEQYEIKAGQKSEIKKYPIKLTSDGNGDVSANLSEASEGTEVILSVEAAPGYRFKEWRILSGKIVITNNAFTMPAEDVHIQAIFEKIAPIIDTDQDKPKPAEQIKQTVPTSLIKTKNTESSIKELSKNATNKNVAYPKTNLQESPALTVIGTVILVLCIVFYERKGRKKYEDRK